ncbi:PrpF domain-containing protein [Actinomadura sp.]|jgi:2-methylaconitate cis-trans-isomerase PrpF|uniref:PrpF domain-containing protein n=1 Tax=Actinomadura sp. TaxID=1989 RepID=UPI003350E132
MVTLSATSSGELQSVPAMLIRGGTSRGVYLLESDLPADRALWGPFLIALFGARDVRQLDGLGGAMPTTSKCCIVGPGSSPGADVDYTFAQVGIGEPKVYWDFNCGNLTPGVGTYAVLKGLVPARPGTTRVRINQTNTRMLLNVDVPTADDGSLLMDGDLEVAGVSGTAAPVRTDFSATVGASLGGGLFPTGNRSDVLDVPGVGAVTCSIVDLANMCVFFPAEQAGLTGYETFDQGPDVVGAFIAVRQSAQRLLGVDPRKTTPWPVAVAPPASYTTVSGGKLAAGAYDFAVRFAGIQPMRDTMHEAYPGTASCCTAVAAVARGTVVHDLYAARPHEDGTVLIGHPSGTMRVEAKVREDAGECVVEHAAFARTVRPIMSGEAYVRRSDLAALAEEIAPEDLTRSGPPPEIR